MIARFRLPVGVPRHSLMSRATSSRVSVRTGGRSARKRSTALIGEVRRYLSRTAQVKSPSATRR